MIFQPNFDIFQTGDFLCTLPDQLQAVVLEDQTIFIVVDHPFRNVFVGKAYPRPFADGAQQAADLRGMDAVEAICVLDRYLDEAMRAKLSTVRIIHGKGTGVLRAAVQQDLKKNKFVKKFRLGQYGEGEDGVTIAEFA